jgi:hypothetical protein
MSRTIDPIQMSQFFALPGASELVEAFSAIPPGPVRDSVVSHAQVLAQASGWTPPVPFGMDPPAPRLANPHEPKRLISPFAEGLAAKSQEGQIIERLMRGEADHVVADDLGVPLGAIVRLKRKAQREGGIEFPGDKQDGKGKPKAWKTSVKPASRKGVPLVMDRFPLPAPPYWWEDPQSPIWHNGRLLPNMSESADGTLAAVGPNDYRTYATMTQAAERNGLTLRQYIARRVDILRRVAKGEKPVDIAISLRSSAHVVYGLLAKVGQSRMETLNARPLPEPPKAIEPEPPPQAVREREAAPRPAAAPPRRAPARSADAAAKTAQFVRERAAERWGFANVESYLHMREQVRDVRLTGIGATEIADRLDMPLLFVKGAIQSWRREYGVVFPEAPMPKRKAA